MAGPTRPRHPRRAAAMQHSPGFTGFSSTIRGNRKGSEILLKLARGGLWTEKAVSVHRPRLGRLAECLTIHESTR